MYGISVPESELADLVQIRTASQATPGARPGAASTERAPRPLTSSMVRGGARVAPATLRWAVLTHEETDRPINVFVLAGPTAAVVFSHRAGTWRVDPEAEIRQLLTRA